MDNLLISIGGKILSGILAGLLGIGGGFLIVSLLVALNYPSIQAIATNSLVIIMSSTAGSLANWRMGYLDWHLATTTTSVLERMEYLSRFATKNLDRFLIKIVAFKLENTLLCLSSQLN